MSREKPEIMKELMTAAVSVLILTQTVYSQVCRKSADIAFVIDSSSSIHQNCTLGEQIKFVEQLVSQYNIGPKETQVSVVTFSDQVELAYSFSDEQTKEAILTKMGGIKQAYGEQTLTHKALKFMREELFSTTNGSRTEAPKICVLLTDGGTAYPSDTLNEATLSKYASIRIIAIGIGDMVNDTELELIVSSPVDKNFFKASNLHDLDSPYFQQLVIEQTCDRQEDPGESCRDKEADIVFIIDQSSSIWETDFTKQLEFVKDIVSHFDIGSGKTMVSMIKFSDMPEVVFYLDWYTNITQITNAILSVKQHGGVTNTHLALRIMLDDVLTTEHGYRPGVAHICVLITDGASMQTNETTSAAQSAHSRGIHVFAIGVGDNIDQDELERMASGPNYTLESTGYDALYKIEDLLVFKVCEAVNSPTCK